MALIPLLAGPTKLATTLLDQEFAVAVAKTSAEIAAAQDITLVGDTWTSGRGASVLGCNAILPETRHAHVVDLSDGSIERHTAEFMRGAQPVTWFLVLHVRMWLAVGRLQRWHVLPTCLEAHA